MVALAAMLEDARLEPAFVALALMPPGEGDIAREIGRDIDPDAIHRARKALRAEIGDTARARAVDALRAHDRARRLFARRHKRRPPRACAMSASI